MALLAETAPGNSSQGSLNFPVVDFLLNAGRRFVFLYLFLSNWVWLDELAINPTRPIRPVFNAIFIPLTQWTGRHLFGISSPLVPFTHTDTPFLYLLFFVLAVLSVVLTIVWTILDRTSRTTEVASSLMRVWIRYTLAYMLLIYAMGKIFPIQFPYPSLRKLVETFGDSSPMGLLWAFMGYSQPLVILAGFAEATGCVLLLFRRTAPLGALICVVMLSNVALMDFCYDVSVKMLAAHFLAMGVFLLAYDAERLLAVMAFNRNAPARDLDVPILKTGPRTRKAISVFKVLVVLYVVVPVTIRGYKDYHQRTYRHQHVPLYGLYEIETFAINGHDHPLLMTERAQWRYVIIENAQQTTMASMDDTITNYDSTYDAASSQLTLHAKKDASPAVNLVLTPDHANPAAVDLLLSGVVGGDHVSATLHKVDPRNFTLVSEGFHWITETSRNK